MDLLELILDPRVTVQERAPSNAASVHAENVIPDALWTTRKDTSTAATRLRLDHSYLEAAPLQIRSLSLVHRRLAELLGAASWCHVHDSMSHACGTPSRNSHIH